MAAGDLTTPAKVRDFLALSTSEADGKIEQLIASSSAWVCSQLGRAVLSATYTETRDGDGGSSLVLRKWPVISVTSVTVDGTAIAARAAVTDSGWTRNESTIRLSGYTFTRGTANVVVVYSAGYATVPADLEQAVIEHVAMTFRASDRQGLASASGGGESAVYDAGREWASIQGKLDPYREVIVG